MSEEAICIDMTDPDQAEYFTVCQLKSRLKMEKVGLKGRGQSAYSQAKKRFGVKGNNKHDELIKLCEQRRDELLAKKQAANA